MSERCASNDSTLLFACSGGSNVGQIANDAAVALDKLGQDQMYCAIGVAAKFPGFVETAAKADKRVLIDGCEVQCLKKAFEAAGLTAEVHVIVTDLGIEKGHHFDRTQDEVARVAGAVSKLIGVTPCCSGS